MIKVLIAEDMEPIRKRYVKILNSSNDIVAIADVGTGEEALRVFERESPDVVLMDIEMETPDAGIRAAERMIAMRPGSKVIILTVYEEDDLIVSAFQVGVCDYIVKNAQPVEIIESIHNAYENKSPLRPEVANVILGEFRKARTKETSFLIAVNIVTQLTTAELETLELLYQGMSRRQICEMRCVEMSTIKSHVHEILRKFNKSSMEEVIDMIDTLQLHDLIYSKTNHKL